MAISSELEIENFPKVLTASLMSVTQTILQT